MRAAALVLVLLLAGCAAPDVPGAVVDEAPPRIPAADWKANLSAPAYSGIVSSLARLASSDGTSLSLTLHLPEGLEADARVPTLLQITPYQPLDARTSSPRGTDGPSGSWAFFVERGAAYVEADARGTGGSEGCLDFGGEADRADARAFAEWIRAQPWSNGVVVTDGVSHPGMGSVVAHAMGDITGALAHAPVVDYYRDEWYQGAKFEDQFNGPLYQAIELAPSAYVEPEALLAQAAPCIGRTTADFEQVDGVHGPLWDERDLSRHVEDARAPILLTQGFIDQNVHPDHVQIYWDALPADAPKHVIWGWWYHGWPDMEGHPAEDFESVRHRWLDALLFGADNGLWNEPRVWVEDSTGVWHEGHDWPLEPSERVRLFAGAGGALGTNISEDGALSYDDAPLAVRGAWTGAHVAFRTEPLATPTLVNGAPRVHLVGSSTESETKWVVYLLDEAPDGSWQRVTHGYADSHTYAGEDGWRAMTPGEPYAFDVMLMPTAVVLDAGHRLTLLVASADSRQDPTGMEPPCWDDHRDGCYAPSGIRPATTAGRATNSVHTGEAGTWVDLAWVDPALTAKPK
jgi:hypothetical protein